MASVALPSLVRQFGLLYEGGCAAGLSDRQLLERFTTRSEPADEAAFAAIVARHGPMVLGICRQLLGDHHHAEDAFQAVFLVLTRRARSIRDPDLLGTWLYGVALRTARKARRGIARRRRTEEQGAMRQSAAGPGLRADRSMIEREQAEALHLEIDRLPGAFRAPVVLCYFEGLTLDEAAQRLRWPAGTLRSRLARAREKLRRGLWRRGFALSATALVAAVGHRSVAASISPLLCDSTTQAAIHFAARHAARGALSAPAAALAQEVLRTMLLHKLKLAALSLMFLAVFASGAGFLTRPPAMGDEPPRAPAPTQAPVAAKPDQAAPGRMFVVGRVLDPHGKTVPGASVMVYGSPKQPDGRPGENAPAAIGQAACDEMGRYRLDAPRLSSATHFMVGAAAIAPGYGTGWVNLDVDADQPVADITLRPEQVIRGRLFDVQGRPAPGVKVSVEGMGHPQRGPTNLPEFIEGPHFWAGNRADNPDGWPGPAITDAEGRFTVRGIGRKIRALLMADDPRFARQRIVVDTDRTAETKPVTAAMEPAKVIAGRVTFADTGKPVPHARIEITAYRGGPGYSNHFETDAEGRFRTNPISTDRYALFVHAPEGQPYLSNSTGIFTWNKGSLEHRLDLVLRRGEVIRGKVVEEGSNRPVAGAALRYVGLPAGNAASGPRSDTTRTGPDGSYQLPVLPSRGTLVVMGPSDDYVLQQMGQRMVRQGLPGGPRWYAHAFIPCEPKPGADPQEINVVLRRGMTIKARVTGPDGRPVREAQVLSRLLPQPQSMPWRLYWGEYHGDVRDGRCELHGLAPDVEVPVYFFEPKSKLGATARFSVKAAAGSPIAVRLEPCGTAIGRLVDPTGKPLVGRRDPYLISMVVTPGPDRFNRAAADQGRLSADADYLSRIDPADYADLVSDGKGRITFPALIPGATYRVFDRTPRDLGGDPKIRQEFTARSGETIDFGDILIEKPES